MKMIQNKLISIIIPCYDVAEYITECVETCYAQTYKNIEVICIDNNSTDNTWNTLLKLKTKHPNLILEKELKTGAPAARNKGLSIAKGEWIQFLDADDLLFQGKIEHQIGLVNKSNCGLIYANYIRRNVIGKESRSNLNDNDIWLNLLNSSLGITSSNLWNKQELINVGCWDEVMTSSQEYSLLFKLLKNDVKTFFDKKYNTIIRERKFGQISQINLHTKWLVFVNLRLNVINFLKVDKKEYFVSRQIEIYQILFDALRILAKYDLQNAVLIKRSFLNNYTPNVSSSTTLNYIRLYKIFGFHYIELIMRLIR